MWWQITKYTAAIQGQNILGLHFQGFILMPKPLMPASFQKATFLVSVIRLRILGLYSLSEQPVPVLGHPAREKLLFLLFRGNLLGFILCPLCLVLSLGHQCSNCREQDFVQPQQGRTLSQGQEK